MKNMVTRLSVKTAIRIMLAGCILLALAISSIGIYFSLKKPTSPELPRNEISFATDKWDGTSSSPVNFKNNFGKRGDNTYTINSADAFIHFTQLVENGNRFEGVTVYLNKNIDLNNHTINSLKDFQGTFDGAYYGIYNANIQGNGLFEKTYNATIQNLGMYNCNIHGTGTAGGLIGTALNTKIENCYVRLGSVSAQTTAAGIVGVASSVEISNTFADTELIAEQKAGLVGIANRLTLDHNYHTAEQTYIEADNLNSNETDRADRINFNTWDYTAEYTLAKTWCNSSSKDLSFNYPILTRFNKVFLTGSCYENVVIKDGIPTNVETIRSAFETIGSQEKGEVNIIVEKVFVEDTAVATAGAFVTLTTSIDTTLERGKTNAEALVLGAPNSSLVIGDLEPTTTTKTIVFDGQKDYFAEKNQKTDAAIVSTGYDFISCSNVMVKNNRNNKTGYGGGISLIFPYKASYMSTDEISAVGIDGTIVMNCESTLDGGGIYVGGTFASFECGFALNISNCKAGGNGGGIAIDAGNYHDNLAIAIPLNFKIGGTKDINLTRVSVDHSKDADLTFYNGVQDAGGYWDISGKYDDVPSGGLSGCSADGNGGAMWINANSHSITLGDSTELTISNSTAGGTGGGVHIENAVATDGNDNVIRKLTLKHLTISSCRVIGEYSYGGGLYADNSAVICNTGHTFKANWNTSSFEGGGFAVNNCVVNISGNPTFECSQNYAADKGGGAAFVNCTNGTFLVKGVTFSNNSAGNYGGGIYLYNVKTNTYYSYGFESVTISGKKDDKTYSAGINGGGIYASTCPFVSIFNVNINNCSAGGDGGGVTVYSTEVFKISGSIYSNTAGGNGGGISIDSTAHLAPETGHLKIYSNRAKVGAGIINYGSLNVVNGAMNVYDNTSENGDDTREQIYTTQTITGNKTLSCSSSQGYTPHIWTEHANAVFTFDQYAYVTSFGNMIIRIPDIYDGRVIATTEKTFEVSILDTLSIYGMDTNVYCLALSSDAKQILIKQKQKVSFKDINTYATRSSSSGSYTISVLNGTKLKVSSFSHLYDISYTITDIFGTTHVITYTARTDSAGIYSTYLNNDGVHGYSEVSVLDSSSYNPVQTEFVYKAYSVIASTVLTDGTENTNCGTVKFGDTNSNETTITANQNFVLDGRSLTVAGNSATATANNGYRFVRWEIEDKTDNGTYTPQQIVNGNYVRWGDNAINVKAVFETVSYTLDFYAKYSSTGNYELTGQSSYDIENGGSVPAEPTPPENKFFKGWVADLRGWTNGTHAYTKQEGTTINYTHSYENGTLTISNADSAIKLILNVTETKTSGLYIVNSIGAGSYGGLIQNPENPILYALWGNEYTVKSHTGETYWHKLFGVAQDEIVESDGIRFAVKADDFTVPFKNTELLYYPELTLRNNAFNRTYNSSNQVMSMGQEIADWYVWVNENEYIELKNDIWAIKDTKTLVGTQSLKEIAEYIDQVYQGAVTEIHIEPKWKEEAIKINVTCNGKTIETKFGAYVNLQFGMSSSGQKISHYEQNITNGKPVAISGIWNYIQLTYTGSNGVYSVELEPVFVDNLYRLDLTGVMATTASGKTYKLDEDSNYSFSSTTESLPREITYKDYDNSLKQAINAEYKSADIYAKNISNEAGKLDISTHENTKKVFTNISSNRKTATNSTGINAQNIQFSIYLKNNQEIVEGTLPKFLNNVYELDYWKNTSINKVLSKHFVYSTFINADGTLLTIDEDMNDDKYTFTDACKDECIKQNGCKGECIKQDVWKYSDGAVEEGINVFLGLTAGYFRKSFELDVKTIFEGTVGEYGYAIITVADDYAVEKVVKYLVTFNNGMRAYKLSEDWKNYAAYTLPEETESGTAKIVIHAGSAVTIDVYDQQRDNTVSDNMVGYKYVNLTSSKLKLEREGTTIKLSEEEITKADFPNGAKIDLNINFDKIEYTFKVQMAELDPAIGGFTVLLNGKKVDGTFTSTELKVKVEDKVDIHFNASIGYEMQEHAFTLSNGICVQSGKLVQDCKITFNGICVQSGKLVQDCNITFSGEWLRTNYYEAENKPNNPTYLHENTTLPTLNINTQEIEFVWNVELIDSSQTTNLEVGIKEGVVTGWTLSQDLTDLGKVFKWNEGIGTYVIEHNGKTYAPQISYGSRRGDSLNSTLLTTTYAFKVSEDAKLVPEAVSSLDIYNMVTSEKGKIIEIGNRILTLVVDVREMCEIELTIENSDKDPNAYRKLTMRSGDNAVVSVEATTTEKTTTAWTYVGANNTLTSVFDAKYATVVYYLDGELLTGSTFKVETAGKHTVVARYVALNIEEYIFKYTLNGEETTEQALKAANIFTSLTADIKTPIYLGDGIKISEVKWNTDTYLLDICVNDTELTSATGNSFEYVIQEKDLLAGKLEIEVALSTKPAGVVIDFAVKDGKMKPTDIYGDVYIVHGGVRTQVQPGVDIDAKVGDKIQVNLAKGYTYEGYLKNTSQIDKANESSEANQVQISITSSGRYTVVLEKQNINVKIVLEEGQTDSYKLSSESGTLNETRTELSDTYLGSEISFTAEDNNHEQCNYFYYLDGTDEIEITGNKLTLTGEILDIATYSASEYMLEVKVSTTPKFKLEITGVTSEVLLKTYIQGATPEEDVLFDANGKVRYHVSGTQIHIEIVVADATEEGKYSLILKDATGTALNVDKTKVVTSVILTEDTILTLEIQPESQGVEIKEYLTSKLGKKEEVTENQVNGMKVSDNTYNSEATIVLNGKIRDAAGDVSQFIERIEIEDEAGVVTFEINNDGVIMTASIQNGYRLVINGDKAEIYYTATSALSIRVDYLSMVEITQ